jgi:hypothetical protein
VNGEFQKQWSFFTLCPHFREARIEAHNPIGVNLPQSLPSLQDPETEAGDGDEEEAGAGFPEPGAADPENDERETLPDTRVVEGEGLPDGREPTNLLSWKSINGAYERKLTKYQNLARAIREQRCDREW